MTLVSEVVLKELDNAQGILSSLGFLPYTVVSRVEVYDRPLQNGAVLQSITNVVTITPAPTVELVSGALAIAYGAGSILSEREGESLVTVYSIRHITPSYTGGGYTVDQLIPAIANPTTSRHVFLISGPGLKTGGEPFKLESFDTSNPLEYKLIVKRTELF